MWRFLLIVTLLFPSFGLVAQNQDNVKIYQDSRIDTLVSKHTSINENDPNIDGWRIQVFFEAGNNSKRLSYEAKSEFVRIYPDVPVYVIFQEPYYKVRIGDYRSRMEAEKFLNEIFKDYPNAFVVSDKINYPRLD